MRFVIDNGIRFGFLNNVKFSDYIKVEMFYGNRVMLIFKYKRVKDGLVIFGMKSDL